MKQKYRIVRDPQANKLAIMEYTELDIDSMSLVCEQSYRDDAIQKALVNGRQNLTAVLRSRNIFPPAAYMAEIVRSVGALYSTEESTTAEVLFDDLDFISKAFPKSGAIEEIEKDSHQLDKLLEDDYDEGYDEKNNPEPLAAALKIADDDSAGAEDAPFYPEDDV
jgi:hypothetical protein